MRPKTLAREPKLRYEAGLVYMTDTKSPTIEQLSKDARFSSLSKKTLERWSKEDKWVERRTAFFEAWAKKAREAMGSKLSQIRQRDLDDLEFIRDRSIELLDDTSGLMPRSWEGVAKIALEATEHRDRIAAAIGAELLPQAIAEQKSLTPADVGMLPEELQLAAKVILGHRRDVHRQGAGLAADGNVISANNVVIDVTPVPVLMPKSAPASAEKQVTLPSIGVGDEYDDEEEDDE
jgi:hypothetical protein